MTIVQLGGCNLQGTIATNSTGHSIFSLPELKEFHAEAAGEGALCTTRKGIGGKLPADLKTAVHLQVLGLYCNVMTGSLAALESLAQLVKIDVHFHDFVGLLPSWIKSKASLLYLSVANNKLTGPISADYEMMSKLTTFGVAFNQFTGPVYKIITALPQLTVIYARGNSFSGVLPPPGAAAAVYDMDNNKFTEFPAHICKQPLPGAYKKSGGCDSDWPAQPFDTCCVSGNALLQCPAGTDTAPACLSNCAVTCISSKGIHVGTWNDLSTFIGNISQSASADYILSNGFSTPEAGFQYITITKGIVTIDGGGHAILDGRGTSRMFDIKGGNLIVKGITLQNGYADFGGAVAVQGGSAIFSSCSFVNNTAKIGGAVAVQGGSATFSNCSFVSNTAKGVGAYGGAVIVRMVVRRATFSSCSFVSNTATGGDGGAVYVVSKVVATFSSCSFVNNTAKSDGKGGAVSLEAGGSAIFSHCSFVNNTADFGGAVFVNGGYSATFSNCSFVQNTKDDGGSFGGAVLLSAGSAIFSNCSFVNNTASLNGGAVSLEAGSATFSSCSFVNNTAKGVAAYGGALGVVGGSGSARIVNCSFEADGNGTDANDNGIYSNGKVVTFGCPTGTTGADVVPGRPLGTSQLPPAKQIVSCH
jgi:predicted outer membrane repeat protein